MHNQAARIARLARLFTFVVPLVLALLLLGVKSAQAAPVVPDLVPLALEEELEELGFDEEEPEEELEFAEEECEIAEEELEEGEIGERQAERTCAEAEAPAGNSSTAAERCPLRSAHAHAVAQRDRLKVTVGYTATESTAATVEIRSGSKRISSIHRHLGRSGVLRLSKDLGRQEVNRVIVRFKTPSCAKFQTKPVRVG